MYNHSHLVLTFCVTDLKSDRCRNITVCASSTRAVGCPTATRQTHLSPRQQPSDSRALIGPVSGVRSHFRGTITSRRTLRLMCESPTWSFPPLSLILTYSNLSHFSQIHSPHLSVTTGAFFITFFHLLKNRFFTFSPFQDGSRRPTLSMAWCVKNLKRGRSTRRHLKSSSTSPKICRRQWRAYTRAARWRPPSRASSPKRLCATAADSQSLAHASPQSRVPSP